MKLLQTEPDVAPEARTTAEPEAAEPAARACPTCSAALAPEQDWCLECGAAQPGRLGQRPGWRAAMTVVGLTLLLALGAVAASYAALTDEAEQVAAAPPPAAAQPTTPPPPSVPPAVPEAVAPPETEVPEAAAPETSEPVEPSDPVDVTPVEPSTPSTPAVPRTTTPEPTGPVAIAVDAEAGSLYDPYANALEPSDAKRALDDDPSTSWAASAAEDADSLAFGYVVDLGDATALTELALQTKTPGFRVEVYATGAKTLPPDVLDERWTHIVDRNDVDSTVGAAPKDGNKSGDGKERIVLGEEAEDKTFRHVLLWFTQLPENGPTIRLTEVSFKR